MPKFVSGCPKFSLFSYMTKEFIKGGSHAINVNFGNNLCYIDILKSSNSDIKMVPNYVWLAA